MSFIIKFINFRKDELISQIINNTIYLNLIIYKNN